MTVVLGPIVSQAADYWGRKWFLVVCTLLGAVGSIIVARASSVNMAIAGFCIIGASFGAQPLLHVVTSEVLPRRWRAYGQAADLTASAAGSVLGLLVGGALNRTGNPASNGFRYYFYMSMALYLVAALTALVAYNPPETEKQVEYRGQTMAKLAKLDWAGYGFLASGLVLFCVGLSYYANPYGWNSPRVSATFAVGVALILGLIVYETFLKKDGMFHHGLFQNRNYPIACVCVFVEGMGYFAANSYFPFQTSTFYEHDAVLVGLRFSIVLITMMVGALIVGAYCAVTRKIRWVTVFAYILMIAFFAAMATTNQHTNTETWGFTLLLGPSLGLTLTTLVTVAQLSVPAELIAVSSGLIIALRSLGGTVGLAIYTAIFNDQLSHLGTNVGEAVVKAGLSPKQVPDFIGALTSGNGTLLAGIPGASPSIIAAGTDAMLHTYTLGFRYIWISGGAFAVVAAIVACFLFDPTKEFNSHIDAPMESKTDLYESSS